MGERLWQLEKLYMKISAMLGSAVPLADFEALAESPMSQAPVRLLTRQVPSRVSEGAEPSERRSS